MTLTLKRIELSNIRSHQYVNFEPAEHGITALSGPNGSGKSTIFDSMAWVLYGTKPHGVPRTASIIRHGTDLSKEKCYAKIWLQLSHSILRIERRIVSKTGTVECEVWEKHEGGEEYTLQAGPSVSHAEPYIKKRLKMDEKGFLAAVLVQQKQVDQLISAQPKDRATVIEKLTGISAITAALTEARQQHNSIKKVLANYSFDENLVENIQQYLTNTEKQLAKKTKERDKLRSEGSAVDNELREKNALLREEEKKAAEVETARTNVATLNATIDALSEELQRVTNMKEEKKRSLDSFSIGADLTQFEKNLAVKRGEARQSTANVERLHSTIIELQNMMVRSHTILQKANIHSVEEAENTIQKLQARFTEGVDIRERLLGEEASARSDAAKIRKAASIIRDGGGECPTCLQHVENVDIAVKALLEEADAVDEKTVKIQNRIVEVEDNITKLNNNMEKMKLVLDAAKSLDGAEERLQKTTKEHSDEAAKATTLEHEITGLEKQAAKAKIAHDIKREYDVLLSNAVQLSDRVESHRTQVLENERIIKDAKTLTPAGLTKLRDKTQELSELRNQNVLKYSEIREECSLLGRDFQHLQQQLISAQDEAKKYADLMQSVETSGNTVAVLDEFREERIRSSVPIVSAYASDLLSRFTDGRFTQLKLDKKFNATVTLANGVERPVGLLSGGELSSAAIALRLAISLLLNSGGGNTMLGLDEVLVSQDAERSELILTTIRDVFQGQLIIISHGPNTNEVADKVIEL